MLLSRRYSRDTRAEERRGTARVSGGDRRETTGIAAGPVVRRKHDLPTNRIDRSEKVLAKDPWERV